MEESTLRNGLQVKVLGGKCTTDIFSNVLIVINIVVLFASIVVIM